MAEDPALVTAVCRTRCNKTAVPRRFDLCKQAYIAGQQSSFFCNGSCTYLSPQIWGVWPKEHFSWNLSDLKYLMLSFVRCALGASLDAPSLSRPWFSV